MNRFFSHPCDGVTGTGTLRRECRGGGADVKMVENQHSLRILQEGRGRISDHNKDANLLSVLGQNKCLSGAFRNGILRLKDNSNHLALSIH